METEIAIQEEAKHEIASMVDEAKKVVIKTEQENQCVANRIVAFRALLTKMEDTIMAPARLAKKNATANVANLEKLFVKPLEEALAILRNESGRFVMAERARREELQRKEDAKFEKAAAKAESTGKPLTVAPRVVAQVQTDGVKYRTAYYAEVTDKKALLAAIVAGTVDDIAVEVNLPYFNGMAKSYKEAGKQIAPGVVCRSKPVVG